MISFETLIGMAQDVLRAAETMLSPALGEGIAASAAPGTGVAAVVAAGAVVARRSARRRAERQRVAAEKDRLSQVFAGLTAPPDTARPSDLSRFAAIDPERFRERLAAARAAGDAARVCEVSREWLAPLRPAMGEALLALAADALTRAERREDLEAVRRCALGAASVEGGSAAADRLLAIAAEAEEQHVFEALSEAGRIAWRIGRVCPARAEATGSGAAIVGEGLYRIGGAMRISGWEAEDLVRDALDLIGFPPSPDTAARSPGPGFRSARVERPEAKGPQPVRPSRPAAAGPRLVALTDGRDHLPEPVAASARRRPERRFRVVERAARTGESGLRGFRMRANLAHDLGRAGRLAEAESAFRQIWEEMRRAEGIGEAHPDTLTARHNLAQMLLRQGRAAAAEEELKAIVALLRRSRSSVPEALMHAVRHGLAAAAEGQGRSREAVALYRELWAERSAGGAEREMQPAVLWCRMRMLLAQETAAVQA